VKAFAGLTCRIGLQPLRQVIDDAGQLFAVVDGFVEKPSPDLPNTVRVLSVVSA
jgi:hypothetical protein